MTKRLDVSTLTLSVKPTQDNANKFMRLMNAAILRGWLILNLFTLLRTAQRLVDKLPDDGSIISMQASIQTRIRKPVQVQGQVTQETGPIVNVSMGALQPVWVTEKTV